MKQKLFYILLFTLGILLAMNACTKRPENVGPADNSRNNYFSSQRNKVQKFTFNTNDNNIIVSKKGTKVHIGRGTLRTTTGLRVTGNVIIELKEVTELSDMILNNAPTISNGKILTSGGEIYVSATQNGEQLTLANNTSFFISIPAPRGTTDSMNVFTGRDSSGVVVWKPVPTDTVNSNVILPQPNQNGYDSAYFYKNADWAIVNKVNEYIVRCSRFGWINCDYFASYPDICSVSASCDTIYKTPYTKVFFTIPATNSMGSLYLNQSGHYYCNYIPNNTDLNIVALNYKDGKYYICIQNHVVTCGSNINNVELNFIEIQESQIESYLSQINI